MSELTLHRERETGLAEDVESEPLRGELGPDGEVTMARVDEEEDQ